MIMREMPFTLPIIAYLFILSNLAIIICYDDFVKKYDVVDFEVIEHRNKREVYHNFSERDGDIELKFACFGSNFHLYLTEDTLFRQIPVLSYTTDSSIENVNVSKTTFYEGHCKDNFLNSSVFGFILDGLFTGKLIIGNTTYFIEPAATFFSDAKSTSKKLVVYRDADIHPFQAEILPSYSKQFSQWTVPYLSPNVSASTRIENSGIDITNQTDDFFCEIEIVVDHTLYNFFKNDTDRLKGFLYLHSKFADYVFSRADFNMDGTPDHIRIAPGKFSIYKSEKDKNYPMTNASNLAEYLISLVSRRQDSGFCLSIAMSYRKFNSMAIGIAFRAEEQYSQTIGGICDQPIPGYEKIAPTFFNTGVINMQFHNGKPLPLAITLLAFTHELGHAFGSDHDPLADSLCSPGKSANYLMFPISSYGSNNAMKFSPCSRKDIWNILLLKGGCLKYKDPVCGNSVREQDEECDCGPEKFCKLIDPCCTPSDAKPPEKGCTIRSKSGFECSPKENDCCNKTCSIVRNETVICHSDGVKCLYSFCDGKSADCPKPQKKPEMCMPKFSCDNTTCTNVTLCASEGLEDCICSIPLSVQCLQCCRKDDKCIPASGLGLVDFDGNPFILKSGTSCNNGEDKCDSSGNCFSNQIATSTELYTSLLVIPFVISAVLLMAICASCQKSKRDNVVLIDNAT